MKAGRLSHTPLTHFATYAIALVVAVWSASITAPVQAKPDRWRAEGWKKTDFSRKAVAFSEIKSGGPGRDDIPPIDKPKFETVANVKDLVGNEPVIGLEVGGEARAYPLRVLTWHEIVNDEIGGIPVAVTYCPLCNAAIVFDRRLDGETLSFGTTGKLRKSDLVMYDRESESWWQQFTGNAIIGAAVGKSLTIIPSRLESFREFKERHPEGRVLVPNNPKFRDYGRNPYAGYDTVQRPFFYSGPLPSGIPAMSRVVVVRDGGQAKAIEMAVVRETGSASLGRTLLTWRPGQVSALDTADISAGREVGTIIAQRVRSDGSKVDVAYDVTFAFVFHAFHPETPIKRAR